MVTYECFKGLADPVRQAIIGFLSQEAQNVSHLVSHFEVSRPAVSRHLRVLRESGLVSETRNGRERLYSIEIATLEAAAEWLYEVAQGEGTHMRPQSEEPDAEEIVETDWRQW